MSVLIAGKETTKSYIRFECKFPGTLKEAKSKMLLAVKAASVKTALYGFYDEEFSRNEYKETSAIAFPFNAINATEIGKLVKELHKRFGNCSVKTISRLK